MGLWLKCPECQAINPLEGKVCGACGASLVNLPKEKRVYYLGPAPVAAPQMEAPLEAAPETSPPLEPAAPPAAAETESTSPPAKKGKGKAAKKKKK